MGESEGCPTWTTAWMSATIFIVAFSLLRNKSVQSCNSNANF